MESEAKICQNCQQNFVIAPEDFAFYQKIAVPEPSFCPECRMKRRFIWRNDKSLYRRKDSLTGKTIFSMFSPKTEVKVYDHDFWWSDGWDAMGYGRDYDFSRPFFEQFRELRKDVPWVSRGVQDMINSDYCMNVQFMKNCYLVFASDNDEDCAYGQGLSFCKDCYDTADTTKTELCYEGFMLAGCYKAFYSSFCDNCREIFFCDYCSNCSDCFGCVNLKHKKYHIFNQPYSKEEYSEKLREFNLGSYARLTPIIEKTKGFWLKFPVPFAHLGHNLNVMGEDIYNSKNVSNSYSVSRGENLKFCQFAFGASDSYDYSGWGGNSSRMYESIGTGNEMDNLKFCFHCVNNCRELEYCIECYSSSNLFGCVGLKKKQYCIFNKQYDKESFGRLRTKIIQQMNDLPYTDSKGIVYKYGEFFPIEFSPFAYNELMIQDFFPLSKEEASKQGFKWRDKPKSEYQPTIKAKDIPDNIKEIKENILKETIECASDNCHGSGVFRLIKPEYEFYRKYNIPAPRLCPSCRYVKRIKQRNPIKFWPRRCQCAGRTDDSKVYANLSRHPHHKGKPCPNEFETTYAPERPEIVYCEKCYQKEVE